MSKNRIDIRWLGILAMLGPVSCLGAAPAVPSHTEILAASCAACHGTNGNSVGGTPVLAGLDPAHFISQMQAFSSKERPSTVMYHHAKGLTEDEIRQLADYFAQQPRTPMHSPAAQTMETDHER